MEEICFSINQSSPAAADNIIVVHNLSSNNCLDTSSTLYVKSQMSSSSTSSSSSSSLLSKDEDFHNAYNGSSSSSSSSPAPAEAVKTDATVASMGCTSDEVVLSSFKDDSDSVAGLQNEDFIGLGLSEAGQTISSSCSSDSSSSIYDSNNLEMDDGTISVTKPTSSMMTAAAEVVIRDGGGGTIFIETPVIDEQQQSHQNGLNSHDFEKAAKPKRLSDEFLLSEDGDEVSLLSSSSSAYPALEVGLSQNQQLEVNQKKTSEKLFVPISCSSSASVAPAPNACDINESSISRVLSGKNVNDANVDEVAAANNDDHNYAEQQKQLHEKMSVRLRKMTINYYSTAKEASLEEATASGSFSASCDAAPPPPLSTSSTTNDIQSMDLIERRDFETEQRLTGGIIIKSSSLASNGTINLDLINSSSFKPKATEGSSSSGSSNRVVSSDSKCAYKDHSTTPTSSRNYNSRLTKSTAKINLSSHLSHHYKQQQKSQHQKKQGVAVSSNVHHKVQPESVLAPTPANDFAAGGTAPKQKSSSGIKETSAAVTGCNSGESSSCVSQHRIKKCVNTVSAAAELLFSNSNSNDSLTSERSYTTSSSSSHSPTQPQPEEKEPQQLEGCSRTNVLKATATTTTTISGGIVGNEIKTTSKLVTEQEQMLNEMASTSSARCLYASTFKYIRGAYEKVSSEAAVSSGDTLGPSTSSTKLTESNAIVSGCSSSTTVSKGRSKTEDQNIFPDPSTLAASTVAPAASHHQQPHSTMGDHLNQLNETDFDDETWPDCEGNSDEEICTCHHSSSSCNDSSSSMDNSFGGIEDDLSSSMIIYHHHHQQHQPPSKDVELSSYIQMVSISEEAATPTSATECSDHQANVTANIASPEFTGSLHQRKRKYNESRLLDNESNSVFGDAQSSSGRKRIAYDFSLTPRSSQSLMHIGSSPSVGRRTPRSIIPTRDNPPPELQDWLSQFQRWSHAERLLAVDRLIEHCEPTQVRHMMKVIEPQFQRDFISLLPRELALQVLAYLDPKDLLRAAQTCRSWRFLCDDNLLWKEKCRKAQILTEPRTDRPKRGLAGNMPPITSPWKAAYMRQHIIEMNWRSRPIRDPKVLKGHDDHVITCLQFYGNRIVSGSDDNTLKVWSAVTGRCLRTLVGHTGGVWSSQMSGNIIISGSTDRTLKVWDMESGQCVHTLLGHTSTVRCMHLHGKKVVSGSRDATLRVWDIEQGTCLHVLVGHLAAVRCVQYDGKLIVSGAYDYMVKIWHPERQECLHTLQGHTNRVYSLQFDGIHVVSGSLDTSIRVWDAETGNCKHTLMGHQSLTSGMELRQNILVSGNADSTVKVWDITSGQCLQTLSGPNKHQSAVTCLQFNSRFVVTSSDDGTVKLWDVKTGEFIRNLVALDSGGSGGVVWRIRANDTKLICAVGSRNGTEETKLMVLDFDVEGACVKCS